MKEFKLVISRNYRDHETTGYSVVFNGDEKVFEFKTLELPIFIVPLKANSPRTNCIPKGTYDCAKIYSPTKGKCFSIENVMGRSNVLIHSGNYATGRKVDTEGCILVGSSFSDINADGEIDVINSKDTLIHLLMTLPNSFKLHIV